MLADMTATELLSQLRHLDVRLWLDGDRLRFSAPKGAMTSALRSELATCKEEIIAFLRRAGAAADAVADAVVGAAPMASTPRTGELPLSFSQERLWFLVEFEPDTPAYNIPQAVRLRGRPHVPALQASLDEIMRRHEALRTTFAAVNGRPLQTISPPTGLPLLLVDLVELPAPERETNAMRVAAAVAAEIFDLITGPLVRTVLLRLAADEHVFVLNIHHIAFDRWSLGVFLREMAALYAAFTAGAASPLPAPVYQYADFAQWQRQWLQGEVLASQTAWWRQQLAGAPPMLQLPTDRPRPTVRTANGAKHSVHLPAALTQGFAALSSRYRVTTFMILLAAVKTVLYRYTGQSDLSVGTFIANRNRPEVEDLIGFFINTLVLRSDLAGDPDFPTLLARLREVTLRAYAHQDLPFERLLEELQPSRQMSFSPLFQVMLVFQNTPPVTVALPGLEASRLNIEGIVWANFDWTLWLWEEDEELVGYIDYNVDLFDPTTFLRLLSHLRTVLAGITADSQRRLSELPLLAPAERQQLLAAWNDTRTDRRREPSIQQLFEAQVLRSPAAPAVVCGSDRRLTYRRLNDRANALAYRLQRAGVGPEVCVGIFAERSPAAVIGTLAVLKAGACYVPLDVTYGTQRLHQLLATARIRVLLTEQRLAAQLPAHEAEVVYLEEVAAAEEGESAANPVPRASAAHLAYLIYTSGSTGRPKGVMVSHGSLVNAYLAWEEEYRLRQTATTHLQMASFSFDVFTADLVRALCSGGCLVLCPRELLLSPPELYALMRAQAVDSAEFVPAVARGLMHYLTETGQSLDFMRLLVVGADVWFVHEHERLRALAGPGTRCINSYGLSEAAVDSSYFEGSAAALPADAAAPIGRPFPGTRIYILGRHLQPVPAGVFGQLCVGGHGLARGYHAQPDLTAEKFLPDAVSGAVGERLYVTGDRARYLPDGNVEFAGRIDQQVKIRGFRIEPGEIEAMLDEHPAVAQAVAAAWKDAPGGTRLVAWVVLRGESAGLGGELRAFLKARLPDYMVPAVFVEIESLPLLPSGKVDRRRLPFPEGDRPELGRELIPPRTPLEEALAEIFIGIIGIERVGVVDNFFELGGDSLLATQAVSRIRDTFEIELPLRTFFESPTIAELALAIEHKLVDLVEQLGAQEIEALL
ncbi:MAG: amino acid adenylation domain-containing protein [bacterium]|nr:amino acid adenylation domain-containing protein [bacterium]